MCAYGAARRVGWRIANGRSGGTCVLLQVQALLEQRLQLPAAPEPLKWARRKSVHGNQRQGQDGAHRCVHIFSRHRHPFRKRHPCLRLILSSVTIIVRVAWVLPCRLVRLLPAQQFKRQLECKAMVAVLTRMRRRTSQ